MMKTTLTVLTLILGIQSARADVVCMAVKKTVGNKITRGVSITIPGTEFSESEWFGENSADRDRAGNACWAIVRSSRCQAETPTAQDQYQNVGDPGFGPRLWVKKSSKAGRMILSDLPSELLPYLPGGFNAHHNRYHAFYSGCEEARAVLAHAVVERMSEETNRRYRASQPEIERGISVPIYEKF
jgi:hypothetical protein